MKDQTSDAATFDYHVFVSHADTKPDKAWVMDLFVPLLERHKVVVSCPDRFLPGPPTLMEMERAVVKSGFTLGVITKDYLASSFRDLEQLMAQHRGLEGGTWPFIPGYRDHELELGLRIRVLSPVDLSDGDDLEERVARLSRMLVAGAQLSTRR